MAGGSDRRVVGTLHLLLLLLAPLPLAARAYSRAPIAWTQEKAKWEAGQSCVPGSGAGAPTQRPRGVGNASSPGCFSWPRGCLADVGGGGVGAWVMSLASPRLRSNGRADRHRELCIVRGGQAANEGTSRPWRPAVLAHQGRQGARVLGTLGDVPSAHHSASPRMRS
ncbi:Hypothetical predicted protein [Marmota monax]|uniref:Uncharacterized protein n=1 Tax=Marmota monax TaxID=9995 RepID=A0A5E4BW03_MARMO|nr:Hypothetical predicted protein [Marmota monax]